MTVSSTCAGSGVNAADQQSSFKQTRADFSALSSALQSGDLTSAQQALAQLQQDNPRLAQAMSSPPSSSDSPRIADLKSLSSALQSGDISDAQQAMAKLQQDGQAARVGGHHHHHHGGGSAAADPTQTDDTSTTVGSLGSVLDVSA